MPRRVAVGLDRNRLAMLVAVLGRHAGLKLSSSDIFVTIAGGIRIDEPAADLAVALAIASAQRDTPLPAGAAVFGEISLTGGLRSCSQSERRVAEAERAGFDRIVVPSADARRAGRGVTGAADLRGAFAAAFGEYAPFGLRGHERRVGGLMYSVGDKVVYPHHGAGKIMKIEQKDVLGQQRDYLTIQILHNDMTVMVPVENADRAGLRKVIESDVVDRVLEVLRGDPTKMPKNWSRRYKHNRDKLKTGDIFEVAEVVRNLAIRHADKGLSTGEKQMFSKAKKILASELMYARELRRGRGQRVPRDRARGHPRRRTPLADDSREPAPVV